MAPPSSALMAAKPPKPPPSPPRSSKPTAQTPLLQPSSAAHYGTHASPSRPTFPPHPTITASTSLYYCPTSASSLSLRTSVPLPGQLDIVSLCVVYWITLVSEASRGLMLPSTWPYFRDLGGTKATLGVFVASFSFGRMATTIPLGYLSDNATTSAVLIYASLLQCVGHLFYAVAPNLTILYLSRIIVGFGSATMSVCRAHLTRSVPASMRTHHFAYLSALQFIGFAVLPGLGGVLALLPEHRPFPFMRLDGYTYPAYLLVFCNLLSVPLVLFFYLNPPPSSRRRSASSPADASSPTEENEDPFPGPDVVAMIVCLLVNVVFRGVIAEFETVSTPFLMEQFDLTYGGASFFISVIGFIGLAIYLSFKPIAKTFSDRALVFFGLVIVLIGCLPLGLDIVADRLPLFWYVFCLGLTWAIAYPIGQTAVLSLFSKVLAGLPAGGFLGIFSATGSVARMFFAMLAGSMWSQFGRESVFGVILAYMTLAAVLVGITFKRLVPHADVF